MAEVKVLLSCRFGESRNPCVMTGLDSCVCGNARPRSLFVGPAPVSKHLVWTAHTLV